MAAEFSLGMFSKLKISNGYLIIGKEGRTVRLADIKSINLTKEGLALNGANAKLTTIKGLSGKKAFAAMDFINNEINKIAAENAKSAKATGKKLNPVQKFLVTIVIVAILAAIAVGVMAAL